MSKDKSTAGWGVRLSIAVSLVLLLVVGYPLAYGPWIWIRSGWFRDSAGSVSYVHPVWKPLYLFEHHVCAFPEPWWHDYQLWWKQEWKPPAKKAVP